MAVERTLSIIKPDAVARNVIGEIYPDTARAEIAFFFAAMDICPRTR